MKLPRSKKADMPFWIIALIILIFGAAILIWFFSGFYGSTTGTAGDNFCMLGGVIYHIFSGPGGQVGLTSDTLGCQSKPLTIYADDSGKCSISKSYYGQRLTPRACAIEQILEAARRCWYMRGQGKLKLKDFTCFSQVKIESKKSFLGIDLFTLGSAASMLPYSKTKSYASVLPNINANDNDATNLKIEGDTAIDTAETWAVCYKKYVGGEDEIILKKGSC